MFGAGLSLQPPLGDAGMLELRSTPSSEAPGATVAVGTVGATGASANADAVAAVAAGAADADNGAETGTAAAV